MTDLSLVQHTQNDNTKDTITFLTNDPQVDADIRPD